MTHVDPVTTAPTYKQIKSVNPKLSFAAMENTPFLDLCLVAVPRSADLLPVCMLNSHFTLFY